MRLKNNKFHHNTYKPKPIHKPMIKEKIIFEKIIIEKTNNNNYNQHIEKLMDWYGFAKDGTYLEKNIKNWKERQNGKNN